MISVIVCTYNRSDMLTRTLKSFFEQTCLNDVDHELLVVDNNSTDDTRQVVERFAEHPTLRYVFESKQGLSPARNRGVAEAKGELVAFLDDDVEVDTAWLQRLHDCFETTGAAVVGGRSYLIYDAPPPDWLGTEFRKMLSEVDFGPTRKFVSDGAGLYGLNLAFDRSALVQTGGFDEALGRSGSGLMGGEEVVIIRKILAAGGSVVYDPDTVVGHIVAPDRLNWDYFRRLADGVGKSLAIANRPASFSGRVKVVLRSSAALARTSVVAMGRRIVPGTPYQRKTAVRRMLTARSRLRTQWGQLWGAGGDGKS